MDSFGFDEEAALLAQVALAINKRCRALEVAHPGLVDFFHVHPKPDQRIILAHEKLVAIAASLDAAYAAYLEVGQLELEAAGHDD